MIETGHIYLIISFVLSIMNIVCCWYSIKTNDSDYLKYAKNLNIAVFSFASLSFLILIYGFISSDFSLKIVFENSHYLMPDIYKFVAVWGNHEGSMFLWVWVLCLSGVCLISWLNKQNIDNSFKSYSVLILSIIYVLFIAFVLFTSNPFERLFPAGTQGADLNPILQDIGLVLHPPLLYIGYVGVAVVYVLVMAGLLSNNINKVLNSLIRPWALLAWAFLSAGIGLGSWWAYYELGWGGFWFWDPVENISLMPWLVLGALLHTILLHKNNNKYQNWIVMLSIASFGFSLLGTFLVRSGILNSIHTFSADPLRGIYLIAIFTILVVGGYFVYALKGNVISNNNNIKNKFISNILTAKVIIILTALFIVLIATLYPLFLDGLVGYKISVGTGYFKTTFIPLAILLLFMLGFIRIFNTKTLIFYILTPIALITCILWWALSIKSFIAVFGVILSLWVCITSLLNLKKKSVWGIVSHLGVGFIALGITGATTISKDYIATMQVGETKQVDDITITLNSINTTVKDNYNSLSANVSIKIDNNEYIFTPEKRLFISRDTVTVESAIKNTIRYDILVNLGNIDNNNITIQVYKKSMMIWLWFGVFMMFMGGFINGISRLRQKE